MRVRNKYAFELISSMPDRVGWYVKTKSGLTYPIYRITQDEIKRAMKPFKFSLKLFDDSEYYTISHAGWMTIINEDAVDMRRYFTEIFDCDDFARYFKCMCIANYRLNAVGFVRDYSARHAYNVIIDKDLNAWIYEPQTDDIWRADEYADELHRKVLCLITF